MGGVVLLISYKFHNSLIMCHLSYNIFISITLPNNNNNVKQCGITFNSTKRLPKTTEKKNNISDKIFQ